MENEQHHYELRSRSRSRSHTPMVSNRPLSESEVTEHHYDLRSKSRERSHTPGEITSSRRSGSRSLTGSSSKMHDKSMETIEENKEGSVIENITDNQSTKSEGSSVTTRKAERRSERQRAKRQIFANGQSESKEDTSDRKVEQKHKSITPRRILTSDYSSEEGEREDPPSRPGSAYEIYKQAGEWWNVFPKTDYTYSRASQCRYEIAPGVLAMPNMSRRSIHGDGSGNNSQISHQSLNQTSRRTTESGFSEVTDAGSLLHLIGDDSNISHTRTSDSAVKSAVYRKTHMEHYSSHRETVYSDSEDFSDSRERCPVWSRFTTGYHVPQYPDSDMESDENFVSPSIEINQRWRIVQWFTYFTTFIGLWSKRVIEFFKFSSNRRQHYGVHAYHSCYESRWSVLRKTLDYYSHKIYFFFVRMLVFDAWLLSQFTGVREQLQGRGLKIFWITFLPLLLLFGCWCIAQCLPFLPAKLISMMMKEKLSFNVQWMGHANVEDKLTSNNDLLDRVGKLENGQIFQAEHLRNVMQILQDFQQSATNFRKKYNDEIVNLENKVNVNELDVVHNRLELMQHEFDKLYEVYSDLKSCCNANAELLTNVNIEKHIEKIVLSYFPPGTSKADLAKITQNLHASLNKEDQTISNNDDVSSARISEEHIRKIVKDILDIYDADKTGRVDYALESAGGQIISTRCTQHYGIKSPSYSVLGFPLYSGRNINPQIVIQGHALQPGTCWAFQGFPGYLLIQLRSSIYVTGFTIEHVSKLLLPKESISSAPRKFNVWGLMDKNDREPIMFGDYEFVYDDNLQYFPVQNMEINKPYEYIELRIHDNHGELNYTCLYRFRVHGKPI